VNKDKPHDRALNFFRCAASSEGRLLVSTVIRLLNDNEQQHRLRRRARKARDQDNYFKCVEAIICDLAYHHLMQELGSLHVSRSHTVRGWRYRPTFVSGKVTPGRLDELAALGLIDQTVAPSSRRSMIKGCHNDQSTVRAGPKLITLMEQVGAVNLSDFTCNYEADEIVVLKSKKETSTEDEGRQVERDSQLVDYEDCTTADELRAEMKQVNAGLRALPITLAPLNQLPPSARLPYGTVIDVNERHVRRYFTCGDTTFQSGGRLFNRPLPFWMWMNKVQRKALIRFAVEESEGTTMVQHGQTIELDYNAMNARLLYGYAGATIPTELEADLYNIPGFTSSREGIKKIFAAMCFGRNLPTWTVYPEEIRENMDRYFHPFEQVPVQRVIEAIRTAHHPVKHLFGTGIGHKLQNIESQIIVAVLLELYRRKIPALPVHDCVLIPLEREAEAREVMLTVFKEKSGLEGKVKKG
jgi:hypothetical protein